jgi:NADPH-dependent glutamate synthase beta subunit-like oxidoreductase
MVSKGMKMTARISKLRKNPYLGYPAQEAAQQASACFQCGSPAPCTLACHNQSDIPGLIRLVGQAACEGLALARWFDSEEKIETARISDAITDCYN